jgi:hypothetical protein
MRISLISVSLAPQLETTRKVRSTVNQPPLRGDEFFPGGMGEFRAPRNQFLVFEEGPRQDITLQWARYSDAADECSLSRIYGGIHPTADDTPGRLMGFEIGRDAVARAFSLLALVLGLAGLVFLERRLSARNTSG